jgi:hypothetical protein
MLSFGRAVRMRTEKRMRRPGRFSEGIISMDREITEEELRSIVIECLRKPTQPGPPFLSLDTLRADVAQIAMERQLKHKTSSGGLVNAASQFRGHQPVLNEVLQGRVWAIIWDMLIEGILRPGAEDRPDWSLPYVYVTAFGKEALRDLSTPYDPDGYLRRLKDKVPNLDPVILTYLAESVETLRRNCLLSSTVTLGCASEQAMLLLIEKTADSLNQAKRQAFDAAFAKLRTIKQQNVEYRNWFASNLQSRLKVDKDTDWLSEIDNALTLLFSYFRVMRNDAGHPTGTKVSREAASANLMVFPHYLRLIYDLMEWLDDKKPI